jgi:hypothetical protein
MALAQTSTQQPNINPMSSIRQARTIKGDFRNAVRRRYIDILEKLFQLEEPYFLDQVQKEWLRRKWVKV